MNSILPSSFRDPSGFLFTQDEVLYRQVNQSYKEHFETLVQSGLYQALVDAKLLLPHQEVSLSLAQTEAAYKIIQPVRVPFISYPYEWSFGQLKDAALATLRIQKLALKHGMTLKDASAYNVQFYQGRATFIDTLSFETYEEGKPWIAYRQFCQHFLAPLALMSKKDVRLSQLLRIYIDGIPLDLASRLLPRNSYLNWGLLCHVHLQAGFQRRFSNQPQKAKSGGKISKLALTSLIEGLESLVKSLQWQENESTWIDYYQDNNYTTQAFEHKKQLVSHYLDRIRPEVVWDFGANTGVFSRLASEQQILTVALESDPLAVEANYRACVKEGQTYLLPLWMDLTNPSSGIGWSNEERMSLLERGPADVIMALALIHHIAIANNVSLEKIADFFSQLTQWLIIEFVPKTDSQVQRLLASREDIFPQYTQVGFEAAFSTRFTIEQAETILDSDRTLYLLKKR